MRGLRLITAMVAGIVALACLASPALGAQPSATGANAAVSQTAGASDPIMGPTAVLRSALANGSRSATGVFAPGRTSAVNSQQALQDAARVIVRFRADVPASDRAQLRESVNGSVYHRMRLLPNLEVWDLPSKAQRNLASIAALAKSPLIAGIEPDQVRKIDANTVSPNDPSYPYTWGMTSINAQSAWARGTGSSAVVVAVVDTGIQIDHPDLADNIWVNPGEIAGNGIDDDGNGYVDDINGWNFINNSATIVDDYGHGTHVAGTIGAVGNNGVGVAGVNWDVSLMALKICDYQGWCYLSAELAALDYAVKKDVRIANNSFGGGYFSQSEYDAIAAAGANGMLFVAAAGNSRLNNDVASFAPASYDLDNIVSVASNNWSGIDELSGFSNYGRASVDLSAPGDSIYSTYPGDTYQYLSGTSMATPHVAGVAALVAAQFAAAGQSWTVAEMKRRLLNTTRDAARGALPTLTGGMLDADAATNLSSSVNPLLHVHLRGTGSGQVNTVVGNCSVLDCRLRPEVATGGTVTVTAVPAAGSTFTGWAGACSGAGLSCVVTMDEYATQVYATFVGANSAGVTVAPQPATTSALPGNYDTSVDPSAFFVKTAISGDGNTRVTGRHFWTTGQNGWCLYLSSYMGGVTVERRVNGEWQQDGSEIVAPDPLLAGVASSRWFNCLNFGYEMQLSRDGNTLLVNLGVDYDPNRSQPSLCGAAVYRRGPSGWETPTILSPASMNDCWVQFDGSQWLEANWRSPVLSADGQRVVVAGLTAFRTFDLVAGTWTLTSRVTLPAIGLHDLFGATTAALSGDGNTFAVGFPQTVRTPVDPYGNANYSGNYYAGQVLVYRKSNSGWSGPVVITPTDSATTGTQALGIGLALSLDGNTMVATYGRTWASVRDDSNWIGGAWILRYANAAWSVVRNLASPLVQRSNYSPDLIYKCPLISGDALRIVCGRSLTWANARNAGWIQVHDSASIAWTGTVTSQFRFLPEANEASSSRRAYDDGDQLVLASGTESLRTVLAGFASSVFTSQQYGANTVGAQMAEGASAPTITSITGSDRSLSVAFTAPTSDGGFGITSYQYSTDGGATWRTRATGTTASPLVISTLSTDGVTPLTNGSTYAVRLRAVTTVGSGEWSSASNGMPFKVATTYTVTGPTSGIINTTSTEFTVTPDGRYTGSITITPSSGFGVNPMTFTWSNSSAAQTFTITPTATGTLGFSGGNDKGLVNPAISSYVVNPGPARTPTFDAAVPKATGFTFNVTNFDPLYTYTVGTTAGSAAKGTANGSLLPVTVTGLAAGQRATVTVTVARTGYATGSGTVVGNAIPLSPTFSVPVSNSTGFTVNVTNYNSAYTYTPTVNAGRVSVGAPSGTSLPLTVSGLTTGQSATVTVTITRTGYATGSGTVTGSALAAAPTISSFSPTSGPVGTSVVISGSNFLSASAVKFNGVAASFTVNSSSSITAVVPSGATSGRITVTVGSSTATSSTNFTVTIATKFVSLAPTSARRLSGLTLSATLVTASGTPIGGAAVRFTFNGKSYNATTNATTGVASVAVTSPSSIGNFSANVAYTGVSPYASSSATWTISIT